MAKIHVYETTYPQGIPSPRKGAIRCVYHVNISAVKDEDVNPAGVNFSVSHNSKLISGNGKVRLFTNAGSGNHPDFPGGGDNITFAIAAGFNNSLNAGNIVAQLKTAFTDEGLTLAAGATVSDIVSDVSWTINDGVRTHTLVANIEEAAIVDITVTAETDKTETQLLANQDIAEVEVNVTASEAESQAALANRVDSLYTGIENRVKSEYTNKYQYYGITRNPA